MFKQDGIFGKKDDNVRKDSRDNVNRTPGLSLSAPPFGRNPPDTSTLEQHAQEPSKAAAKQDDSNESKLIVGPNIKLKGAEITDCDTLVVEGRVEAAMDSRVIRIAEHGVFAGTVGIDVAEIRGRFEGELTARKQLVIHSTGRVSGKIRYGKITIEEGGELSGDVSALHPTAAVTTPKGASLETATADIMTPAYDPFARKNKVPSGKPATGVV